MGFQVPRDWIVNRVRLAVKAEVDEGLT